MVLWEKSGERGGMQPAVAIDFTCYVFLALITCCTMKPAGLYPLGKQLAFCTMSPAGFNPLGKQLVYPVHNLHMFALRLRNDDESSWV